jgi:hypothetical protein
MRNAAFDHVAEDARQAPDEETVKRLACPCGGALTVSFQRSTGPQSRSGFSVQCNRCGYGMNACSVRGSTAAPGWAQSLGPGERKTIVTGPV